MKTITIEIDVPDRVSLSHDWLPKIAEAKEIRINLGGADIEGRVSDCCGCNYKPRVMGCGPY